MNHLSSLSLITGAATDFGTAILAIVGVILVIAGGVLIFRWGWLTLMNLPGGSWYDSSKGSGMSRWSPRKNVRGRDGSINLLA